MNGATERWTGIPLPDSRAVALAIELGRPPISLWWTEFDSADPEEYDMLLKFMAEPLTYLAEALPDVEDDWHVVTSMHNHHRRLNPRIHFFNVTVAPDEKTCYVSSTKQNDHPTE